MKANKQPLEELEEIKEQVSINRAIKKSPFAYTFKLHKQGVPVYKIAKRTGIPAPQITQIIHGQLTIPKAQIKAVKLTGLTICRACKKRIVPLEPFDYVQLTVLCPLCWKKGGEEERAVNLPSAIIDL